jgi:CheY-like chemotaxis protein
MGGRLSNRLFLAGCAAAVPMKADYTTCLDGIQALKSLKLKNYEAVVSDLHTPGVNGLTFIDSFCLDLTKVAFGTVEVPQNLQQVILSMIAGASDHLCTPLCSDDICRESAASLHERAPRALIPETAE